MRNFQCTFKTRKGLFVSAYSIYMTTFNIRNASIIIIISIFSIIISIVIGSRVFIKVSN